MNLKTNIENYKENIMQLQMKKIVSNGIVNAILKKLTV